MNLVENPDSGLRHVIDPLDARRTLCGKWITLKYQDFPTWGDTDKRAQVSCRYCARTIKRQGWETKAS